MKYWIKYQLWDNYRHIVLMRAAPLVFILVFIFRTNLISIWRSCQTTSLDVRTDSWKFKVDRIYKEPSGKDLSHCFVCGEVMASTEPPAAADTGRLCVRLDCYLSTVSALCAAQMYSLYLLSRLRAALHTWLRHRAHLFITSMPS